MAKSETTTTAEGRLTEQTRKAMPLSEKLLHIINEIGPIDKGGFNSHSNYKYHRESDLFDRLRVLLLRYGVTIIPTRCASQPAVWFEETGKSEGWRSCTVSIELHIINSDDPKDNYLIQWEGSGRDKGEKGLYKAYTGAMKQALLKLFLISDSEADPEYVERASTKGTARASAAQRQTATATDNGASTAEEKQQEEEKKAKRSRPLTPAQLAAVMIGNARKDPQTATPAHNSRMAEDLDRILIGDEDRQVKLLSNLFGLDPAGAEGLNDVEALSNGVPIGGHDAFNRWVNPATPEERQYMKDELKECLKQWKI